MNVKITVSRSELLAALLFASTDESRYVLNGVLIESSKMRKPVMVATDGRRLVVIESLAEQEAEGYIPHTLLLRADFIKPICALSKALGGKLFPWITFEHAKGSQRLSVSFVGPRFFMEAEESVLIEGEYPDWREVVPSKKAERTGITDLGLNAEFVGDFARVAKLLEAEYPIIQMNLVGKDHCVEVKIPGLDNFYGIVMPCKADESLDYQPEFLSIIKSLPEPPQPKVEEAV